MGASEQQQVKDGLPAILLDITAENAPMIFQGKGLNHLFEQVKAFANEVPDVSTKKGRDRIVSLGYKVTLSKTAVEKPGRAHLALRKSEIKPLEAELREWVTNCDSLRDSILEPLKQWKAEQERIAAEQKAAEEAAALARQIEADHELALLMNREIDREREEAAKAAEQARIEREAEIAQQAAEQARIEAEQKAEAERQAAIQREVEAKLAQERAEADRLAAIKRAEEAEAQAERDRIEAAARAEQAEKDAKARQEQLEKEAAERAEAARLRAIEDERRRVAAQQEAEAAEQRRREADEEHRAKINRAVLDALMQTGLTEDQAKEVIRAIVKGKVPHTAISY